MAPPLLVGLLVLSIFVYLQVQQGQALEYEKFKLAEHLIDSRREDVLDSTGFLSLANSLLSIEPLHRVSLFDSDRNQVDSEGLPTNLSDQEIPLSPQAQQWRDSDTSYRSIPVRADGDNRKISGWIVLEMDRTPFSVLHYQSTIVILLITFAALVATYYSAGRLRRLILEPLQQLYGGLANYLAGNHQHTILVEQDAAFQNIADSISELAQKQQLAQEDMQTYLEQYTQELRETLETVEVQNIELDMARKNALNSSRAKSEFLANASHELRTPLSGILGFSSLLLKTDLSNQQKDYLSTIEQSAQGLLTIINDILDISRLETGQLTLEYKPVPIYQTIEDVLKIHAPSAHEKKLRLITLVDPQVPDNLLGDPLRLKQVITNLVSNAVKFSEKGSVVIQVKLLGETDNQIHLKFCISDSGIGLSPEQKNSLFESFSHVDTADNRLHGGTGLGLAIARGLVSRMHGDIGVESELHCGSTFWFTARLGLNNQMPSVNKHRNSLRHIRALVFDCDPLSRSEVTHLLDSWGAEYVQTGDFDELSVLAKQCAAHQPVQIAVLDAQVNEELFDKHRLCACVEKLNSQFHLPVIILAVPGIHRMLEPMLEGLQATVIARPLAHDQVHRVICNQLGTVTIASTEPPERGVHPDNGGAVRVLAVDDNPANLRLVSELLKGLGAQVDTANNGQQALDICADKTFDLILMDIQMPGMDGMETTQKLRQQESSGRRTPVVALTAHAVNEQKARLLLAGMDDYLSKPVSDMELRHLIDRWVRHAHHVVATAEPAPAEAPSKAQQKRSVKQQKGDTGDAEAAGARKVFDISEALKVTQQKVDLAGDMFAMLLNSLDEISQKIKTATDTGDMEELQEVVHKLHGGCCYCGVPALRQAAADLDAMLQRKQYNELTDATDLLLQRIDELQQWAAQQDVGRLWEQD